MKFNELCEAYISKGLLKAMSNPHRRKAICPKCGYIMPIYPGKYCACPLCQTRFLNDPNPVTNQDNGELAVVDNEVIDFTSDSPEGKVGDVDIEDDKVVVDEEDDEQTSVY